MLQSANLLQPLRHFAASALTLCILAGAADAQTEAKSALPTSLILVDTDDSCRLMVDDVDEGIITPDQSKKVRVRTWRSHLEMFHRERARVDLAQSCRG